MQINFIKMATQLFYTTREYRLIKKNSTDSFRQINSKFQTHPYINIKHNICFKSWARIIFWLWYCFRLGLEIKEKFLF